MEQSCRRSVLKLCQYCEVGSSWTTTRALLLHCNNIRSLGYISLLHPTTTLVHEEQEEEAEETASSLLLLRTKTRRALLCFPPCRADRQRPRGGGSPSSPHSPSRSLVVSQANENDSDRKNQFPSSLLHIPDTCSEPPKRVRGSSSSSQNHSPYFPYTWATTSNNLSSCGNLFPICKRKQKAPAGSTTHHPPPAFFHFRLARSTIASPPSFLPSFLLSTAIYWRKKLLKTRNLPRKSTMRNLYRNRKKSKPMLRFSICGARRNTNSSKEQ